MSSNPPRSIKPGGTGFINDLTLRFKLILRLMGDKRVNPLLKVLPVATLVYLVVPDILPGPIDDAAIIWLGTSMFVELCPQPVVQEHMDELRKVVPAKWKDAPLEDDDTVDAEFHEVSTPPGGQNDPTGENRVR